MTDEASPMPCCKPLRLLELCCMILCFAFVFLTRSYEEDKPGVLSADSLIILFVTYGSLIVLTGADVLSQMVREPTTNTAMIMIAIMGCTFTFVSGIVLLIPHYRHWNSNVDRKLHVTAVLSGTSFLSSIVYMLDAIVLIRFYGY